MQLISTPNWTRNMASTIPLRSSSTHSKAQDPGVVLEASYAQERNDIGRLADE